MAGFEVKFLVLLLADSIITPPVARAFEAFPELLEPGSHSHSSLHNTPQNLQGISSLTTRTQSLRGMGLLATGHTGCRGHLNSNPGLPAQIFWK